MASEQDIGSRVKRQNSASFISFGVRVIPKIIKTILQ